MKDVSNQPSEPNKSLLVALQAGIVAIGIAALSFMLWEPHLEGRNAHASLYQVYFNDPFLAYAYIGSIPFFVALYQIGKLIGYARQNKQVSQEALKSLGIIKYCAFITAAVVVSADVYVRIAANISNDDPAGFLMLGMIATLASVVVGVAAARREKQLRTASSRP